MTMKQLDRIEALFVDCDDTSKDVLNEDNQILYPVVYCLLNPGHFSDFHQSVRDMLPLEKFVIVRDDLGQLATRYGGGSPLSFKPSYLLRFQSTYVRFIIFLLPPVENSIHWEVY